MLKYMPSMIMASAICLSRLLLGLAPFWPTSVEYVSSYTLSTMSSCLREMVFLLNRQREARVVSECFESKRKYGTSDKMFVSRLRLPQLEELESIFLNQ